jgi:hypothetical protein
LIATLSRTASTGELETETADDFVTTAQTTFITNATLPACWSAALPQLTRLIHGRGTVDPRFQLT